MFPYTEMVWFSILCYLLEFSNFLILQWEHGIISPPQIDIYYPIVFLNSCTVCAVVGNGTVNVPAVNLNYFKLSTYNASSSGYYGYIAIGF